MELFRKNSERLKAVNYGRKNASSYIDVRLGSKYASNPLIFMDTGQSQYTHDDVSTSVRYLQVL